MGSPTETPIATAVLESLHRVKEIRCTASLVDTLVLNGVELMRMWLQRATLTSMDSTETPSTSGSEEVTNACTLANEWAEED